MKLKQSLVEGCHLPPARFDQDGRPLSVAEAGEALLSELAKDFPAAMDRAMFEQLAILNETEGEEA